MRANRIIALVIHDDVIRANQRILVKINLNVLAITPRSFRILQD